MTSTTIPSSHLTTFHHIPPISAFQLPRTSSDPTVLSSRPPNVILWVGGLSDTFGNVSYPFTLAQCLPPSWTLVHLVLSSSGNSWGTTDLDADVREIAKAVAYFRSLQEAGSKIVLMGHSTGCQDAMHYVSSPLQTGAELDRPRVAGIILQAPISDREALLHALDKSTYDHANDIAQKMVRDGKESDCMPNEITGAVFGQCAITAKRWLSLASPDQKGDDDYFSSDLPDERLQATFGSISRDTHLLLLYGAADEHVPEYVKPVEMLERWTTFASKAGAKVHPESRALLRGASHNLNGDPQPVLDELYRRVTAFLADLAKHV
ncbi:hypothetical protein CAC42_3016 [Sphaceloma murrayae]|uniref:Uncharacterized protein n=1 Tax=Sphaceloma murrayae TaxID=2082308 RepID=A0A2K1QRF7_9PEZI|nr:hypothetical protein CAC42_3016 [Sphaceloma murrayae]